jgi:hypothetical protein
VNDHLSVDLTEVVRLVRDIAHEAPWSDGVGYTRDQSQGERLKGGGVTDPTGETVVSGYHSSARSRSNEVRRRVARARRELEAAV